LKNDKKAIYMHVYRKCRHFNADSVVKLGL